MLCKDKREFRTRLPEAINPRQGAWLLDETPPSCFVETDFDHTQTPGLKIVSHDRVQLRIFGSLHGFQAFWPTLPSLA